jgi:nitric oxide dioxygenase
MVSPAARPYIDASVAVLREHGVAITTRFYRSMFIAHPELNNLFNMGNQASGAQQQSLAAAVFAYAANIDNAAALAPVIKRIVHKHVSIGIKPEHYPIVGKYLLAAIADTLGQAATPALLSAWEEAYTELANLFIAAEVELYGHAGIVAGEFHPMRVVGIDVQSLNVLSYTLQAADEKTIPAFQPGQYVSVAVNFPDGSRQIRQYSLSDASGRDTLRISVKREDAVSDKPEGQVSNWLHQHVRLGGLLQVSHPFGEFTPDSESMVPIVLISAGIGITPMVAVLNRIAQICPEREVVFAHAAASEAHHAHRADIGAAQTRMPHLQLINFYETAGASGLKDNSTQLGLMQVDQLPKWQRDVAQVYLCGPVGFMKVQWRDLLAAGVPAANLHREVFGPDLLDNVA